MAMSEELINRFKMHPAVTDEVRMLHTTIRDTCALFTSVIVSMTPQCREQSLAITKIEEAMFWATAAVARDPAHEAQEEPVEVDPLEDLSDLERDKLPFVLVDTMSSDRIYRIGHLHGKDGRCIRNRYGPLCTDPGATEVVGRPRIVTILSDSTDDDLTGVQPQGFDS